MRENTAIACELLRIACQILAYRASYGGRRTALTFSGEDVWNNYQSEHDVRKTTRVVVDGRVVQEGAPKETAGRDLLGLNVRDASGSLHVDEDGFLYIVDNGEVLPRYYRIQSADVPDHTDDITNISPEEKRFWVGKCKVDIERLNPGLWQSAQEAYDDLDNIEKQVMMAYTSRDFYGINKSFFRIYSGKQKDFSAIQMYEAKRLFRLLKKLPRFNGNVWRGMLFDTQDALNKFTEKWSQGNSPMTGFISTTYSQDKIRLYIDKDKKKSKVPCVIRIVDSHNGRYLGHLSSTPKDEEILFSCNQRFRLVEKGRTEFKPVEDVNGIRYITVKEDREL